TDITTAMSKRTLDSIDTTKLPSETAANGTAEGVAAGDSMSSVKRQRIAPPVERMVTRGVSGAIRHKHISELTGGFLDAPRQYNTSSNATAEAKGEDANMAGSSVHGDERS